MAPPSIPPPTSAYLKVKKEESAAAAAAPRPYMASAAAAADVEAPPGRGREAGDAVTGWPVVQPDPYPGYVKLSSRMRTILCPDAFACGPLCIRLPLYLLIGLLLGPLIVLLGIGLTLLLLLALTCLWYPAGVALSWLFPGCWPGFSPPTTLIWKAARLFQTLRSAMWQQPRAGEWKQANLAEQSELSTGLLHYAVNIRVPLASEDELATTMGQIREVPPASNATAVDGGFGSTNLLFALPPDGKIDEMEAFAPEEDPVAYVMDSLRYIYPSTPQEWTEKLTDQALSWFCVYGIGAHRLEKVTDNMRGSYIPAQLAPPSAAFVVKANMLSCLNLKEGCDSYGGDCFLDAGFNVVCIVRQLPAPSYESEKFETFFPPDSPLLYSFAPSQTSMLQRVEHSIVGGGAGSSSSTAGTRRDPQREWDYAKFVFRSTMFGLVTFVDHLYGLHLQVSNIFTTAMRERLPKSNPLRSFLVPFTYGAISINDAARLTLVMPNSWLPRAFPFNDDGLQLGWATAYRFLPYEVQAEPGSKAFIFRLFDRGANCRAKLASGVQTEYWRQALEYWKIILGMVQQVISTYWPNTRELVGDPRVRDFMLQSINEIQATSGFITSSRMADTEEGASWDELTEEEKVILVTHSIAFFIYLVTAGHEQVGRVQAYAQDPTFASFSWSTKVRDEGVMACPKPVAIGQGLIMSLTSTPMPRLLVTAPEFDWSRIWLRRTPEEGAALDAIFARFQENLAAFSLQCSRYNDTIGERSFPDNFGLWSFDPALLETSVSI